MIREGLGWILLVLGSLLIGLLVYLAWNRMVFEAMALSFPAVIVFRAGVGFLRMATASRIAKSMLDTES